MNVILRMFLKSNHATDLILPRQEALQILDAWKVGTVKGVFGGTTADGVPWGAKAEDISVLVVLPYQEPQQQHPAQQTIPLYGSPRLPGRA